LEKLEVVVVGDEIWTTI